MFAPSVTVHVEDVPEQPPPDQPESWLFAFGTALSVTTAPLTYIDQQLTHPTG